MDKLYTFRLVKFKYDLLIIFKQLNVFTVICQLLKKL